MKTDVPRAWCPSCRQEIRPAQVLLQSCPHCGAELEDVLVDRKEARRLGLA